MITSASSRLLVAERATKRLKLAKAAKVPSTPYQFYGGNLQAKLCLDPEVIVAGPADTGKTLALLHKLHILAYEYPGCQLAIIRKRKSDIVGSVFRTFKRDLLDPYGPGTKIYGGEHPQWIDYPGGARIWMGGMDDPGKTLSSERDLIYCNQTEELSLSDWEYLTRPVTGRGAVIPHTQLIGDANPGPPTHWIRSRQALTLFESTHRDNPQIYDPDTGELTEQGKQRLGRLANLTGSRKLRLYQGLWAAPEGAIYDVFDEERHKVKSFAPPPAWSRAVGIDPFGAQIAALWVAFDPVNGILNVYREYCEPFGLTAAGHAEAMLKLSQGEGVYAWVGGGPSERAWRTEFQAAGIPLLEPPVSDVWVGIDRVYQLLKEFRLVIHDSCVGLLSEIGDYRRKMSRDGIASENIENKERYHHLDALRYIVAWLVEPAEQEQVWSPWQSIR